MDRCDRHDFGAPQAEPGVQTTPPTFEESLRIVADQDVQGLIVARKAYGESWCKRGGPGAYMTLARKIDRMEQMIGQEYIMNLSRLGKDNVRVAPYDIFAHCLYPMGGEGILDQVRDLRRYLMLVEAKLLEQGHELPTQRDNK